MSDYNKKFQDALEAGKKRDYEKAILLLTEIICNTDDFPQALLYLGRSYHAAGDAAKGVRFLELYIKKAPDSLQGSFFLGRAYLSLGIYKKAVIQLKKILEKKPDFYFSYALVGMAFLKLKRPEIALNYFETAIKYAPQNQGIYTAYLNTLLIKAIKYFHRNRMQEAKAMFLFLLDNRKESFLPRLYLARIYKESGELQNSLDYYKQALEFFPDDQGIKLQIGFLLLSMGKADKAAPYLKDYKNIINPDAKESASPLYQMKLSALTAFNNQNYKEAVYSGNQYLKKDYRDPDVHAVVAESYSRTGELEKAKNHYERSLESRYNIELHYAMIQILYKQAKYDEVLKHSGKILNHHKDEKLASYFQALAMAQLDFEPAKVLKALQYQIKQHGPDPQLLSSLGQAYFKYDMPDLAVNWFLKTLKLLENDQLTLYTLIQAYKKLNRRKELLIYYPLYLDYYPAHLEIKKDYIRFLAAEGKYKTTVEQINGLLPYEPGNTSLKKLLGHCYMKTKKYDEAIVIFKGLLAEKPDNMEILQMLVFCLDSSGRRKAAIVLLKKAASFFKETYKIHSMLGTLYFKDNEYEKALDVFRSLLTQHPSNWHVHKNLGMIYKKMGNDLFAEKFLTRAEEYKRRDSKG